MCLAAADGQDDIGSNPFDIGRLNSIFIVGEDINRAVERKVMEDLE